MPMRSRTGTVARLGIAALVVGLVVSGVGPAAAQGAKQSADSVVQGAKEAGKGVEDTAKGIGKTVVTGAKEVGQRAQSAGKELDPQGRKLHDSAKAFGESISFSGTPW